MEWIEEDVKEIASSYPETSRLQLLSADPFVLSFERLNEICDLIHRHLPNIEIMTMAARVDNISDKSVEELKILKDKGFVSSVKKGKAHLFTAIVKREEYMRHYMEDVKNTFFRLIIKNIFSFF